MSHASEMGRGLRARKHGEPAAYVTAYVPPGLALELRVRAARDGRTQSAIVADALAAHLHAPQGATAEE